MTRKKKSTEDIPQQLSYHDKLKLLCGDKKEVETIENKLQPVFTVPTMFTSFNRAICAGGAPVRCTYLIHGPPGGGKSIFTIGLMNSFVEQGHFAAYIDAEHASTKEWYSDLKIYMDKILYKQPDTFEEAIDYVDEKMVTFKQMKKDGIIDPNTCFMFAVDTIHKLAPKGELDELRSDKKGGGSKNINKGWGMRRANMIKSWLNKLTPIIGKENFAFIAVAHESEEDDKSNPWQNKKIIKTKGGVALVYESMARIRIMQSRQIYEDSILVGKTHIGKIEKNKVGHDKEQFTFFVGNGKGTITRGFDIGMELYEEATSRGILLPRKKGSSWFDIDDGNEIHAINGKENVIEFLRTNDSVYKHYYNLLQESI